MENIYKMENVSRCKKVGCIEEIMLKLKGCNITNRLCKPSFD